MRNVDPSTQRSVSTDTGGNDDSNVTGWIKAADLLNVRDTLVQPFSAGPVPLTGTELADGATDRSASKSIVVLTLE